MVTTGAKVAIVRIAGTGVRTARTATGAAAPTGVRIAVAPTVDSAIGVADPIGERAGARIVPAVTTVAGSTGAVVSAVARIGLLNAAASIGVAVSVVVRIGLLNVAGSIGVAIGVEDRIGPVSAGGSIAPKVADAADTTAARVAVVSNGRPGTVARAVAGAGSLVLRGRAVVTLIAVVSGAEVTAVRTPVAAQMSVAETSAVRLPSASSTVGSSTGPTAGTARSVGAVVKVRRPRAVAGPIGARRGRKSRRCPTTSRPVNWIRRSGAIC